MSEDRKWFYSTVSTVGGAYLGAFVLFAVDSPGDLFGHTSECAWPALFVGLSLAIPAWFLAKRIGLVYGAAIGAAASALSSCALLVWVAQFV